MDALADLTEETGDTRAHHIRQAISAWVHGDRHVTDIPEWMMDVVYPKPGRRHPGLLVSPPEMTHAQWDWVLNSDYYVYVAEATDPDGKVMKRWMGNQDWEYGVHNYLTESAGYNKAHTVRVWDGPSDEPAVYTWSPQMQAETDEERAREERRGATRMTRSGRLSRRAAEPKPKPAQEPLADWERELLGPDA